MLLKEIASDDDQLLKVLQPEDIKKLKTECSNFIKSTNGPLLRGAKYEDEGLLTIPIRTNRHPKDTSPKGTLAFNLVIEKLFGVKEVRNRSAFCSKSISVAGVYGHDIFFVFPTNEVKFLIGEGIEDSLDDLRLRTLTGPIHFQKVARVYDKDISDKEYNAMYDIITDLSNKHLGQLSLDEVKQKLSEQTFNFFIKVIEEGVYELMKDKYELYDTYTPDINNYPRATEIIMFGAPHFYAISGKQVTEVYDAPNVYAAFSELLYDLKGHK